MRNNNLPDSVLRAMESLVRATNSYSAVMDVLKNNRELFAALSDSLVSKFSVMDTVFTKGILDNNLAKTVSDLLKPYHEITDTKTVIEALGSSFKGMIKPDVYVSANTVTTAMENFVLPIGDYRALQTTFESLIQTTQMVDTAWLKSNSTWLIGKDYLESLNVGNLSGLSSAFSHLCVLEHETSQLTNIPPTITSAAVQIASITEAFDRVFLIGRKYCDYLSTSRLISDFCGLASRQHELIQKAADPKEVSWRLGVLDAASKYVDRQVGWYLGFFDAIAEEEFIDSEETVLEAEQTALSLIPTHIGFTRRVDKSPTEGLEQSLIVTITEKGKRIAENVIKINKLRLDTGEERIFGLSETVVEGMLDLSTVVCSTEKQLGIIVDVLYFVFYENLKHIKILIGLGDENKGDQMVRKEDIYQCIFDIKTLRNDLRHDLDHGKPSEVKKKLKSIGNCYKKYCGNRPLKPKDYKKLQEQVYDKVIELEDALIQIILPKENE